MKERPILFSGPMVRAILDDGKTQTRRPIKSRGRTYPGEGWSVLPMLGGGWTAVDVPGLANLSAFPTPSAEGFNCPFGVVGDKLWVRETFAACTLIEEPSGERRSHSVDPRGAHSHIAYHADDGDPIVGRWRPSIHMPRWASRITLTLTDVRVQRVQDISEEDAKAEGVEPCGELSRSTLADHENNRHRCAFRDLWDRVYGDGAWTRNDWVWALTFTTEVRP